MGLLDYVMRRLKEEQAAGANMSAMARACDVKRRWLVTLAAGQIPEPGVLKIERLARYLRACERTERESAQETEREAA